MKTLGMVVLISATLTFPVYAQSKTTKEVTYALAGPVRTVRTEVANVSKKDGVVIEGARILNMTISFNEAGNRTELGMYDEKGSLSRRIVTRFEEGREVEFLNYDGAGRMWLRGANVYDAEGRVSEKATYNGDGSLRSKTTLARDERGRVIEMAEYDANGRLLEKFSNTYDAAGGLKTSERSSYAAAGWLHRRESQDVAEKRSVTVTYNPDGSPAGKSIRVNQQITEYAADGSPVKSTLITGTGRLLEETAYNPDGTTRKESQIPDELDAHGNWIKRTDWVTDARGTRPVKVTYRAIAYY